MPRLPSELARRLRRLARLPSRLALKREFPILASPKKTCKNWEDIVTYLKAVCSVNQLSLVTSKAKNGVFLLSIIWTVEDKLYDVLVPFQQYDVLAFLSNKAVISSVHLQKKSLE